MVGAKRFYKVSQNLMLYKVIYYFTIADNLIILNGCGKKYKINMPNY